MSKRQKRLEKLRQNPKVASFESLKQVLMDYGFDHVRTAGSHHTFIAVIDDRDWRLTIPLSRPIKTPYVRAAITAIDEIIAYKGDESEEENDE